MELGWPRLDPKRTLRKWGLEALEKLAEFEKWASSMDDLPGWPEMAFDDYFTWKASRIDAFFGPFDKSFFENSGLLPSMANKICQQYEKVRISCRNAWPVELVSEYFSAVAQDATDRYSS